MNLSSLLLKKTWVVVDVGVGGILLARSVCFDHFSGVDYSIAFPSPFKRVETVCFSGAGNNHLVKDFLDLLVFPYTPELRAAVQNWNY